MSEVDEIALRPDYDAAIGEIFPDAWRREVNGESKFFVCTVLISGTAKRAMGDEQVAARVASEREMATKDMYRGVARQTGLSVETLREQTTVRFVDQSHGLVNGILEVGALVPRETA